jgi:cytochrome c553
MMRNLLATLVLGTVATCPVPALAQVPDAIKDKVAVCAACHGEDGNNDNPLYPVLAGQSARYIFLELRDFKAGRRHDPTMEPIAQALSPEDMLALGTWFSRQKPRPSTDKTDPAKVAAGRQKAEQLLCTMCHLGGFQGQNEIPRVAGQHEAYIRKQLADFKARRRTNDAGSMTSVTSGLSDQDIDNLAQYVTSLY